MKRILAIVLMLCLPIMGMAEECGDVVFDAAGAVEIEQAEGEEEATGEWLAPEFVEFGEADAEAAELDAELITAEDALAEGDAQSVVNATEYDDDVDYFPKKMSLGVKETFALDASERLHGSGAITYTSSNKRVASVNRKTGAVKAKKVGTAKITAKQGRKKVTCKITVKKAPKKVTVSPRQLTVALWDLEPLKVKLPKKTASHLTYTSSDESVAIVDNVGWVHGMGVGTATVTVRTFNGREDTCEVTVAGERKDAAAVRKDILDINDRYKDSAGFIPPEDVPYAIAEVGEAIRQAYEEGSIRAYATDDFGVYYIDENNVPTIWQPNVEGYLAGGNTASLEILELEPCDAELGSAAGERASRIASGTNRYYRPTPYAGTQVTVDRMTEITNNQVVLLISHGGHFPIAGLSVNNLLLTGEKWTDPYTKISENQMEKWNDGTGGCPYFFRNVGEPFDRVAVSPSFVADCCGEMENTFIFLGTCFSGEHEPLMQAFADKGASVIGFSNLTSVDYSTKVLDYVLDKALSEDPATGRHYTIGDAFDYGKKKAGVGRGYIPGQENRKFETYPVFDGDRGFSFYPGVLTGTVYDGDAPVESATVRLRRDATGMELQEKTGKDGTFTFNVPAGSYMLDVSAEGYQEISCNTGNVRPEMTTVRDVAISRNKLIVRVVDSKGENIEGATVTLKIAGKDAAAEEKTDQKGEPYYELREKFVPGTVYKYTVSVPGYVGTSGDMAYKDSSTELTVALDTGGKLTGAVVDKETQQPVSGASVELSGQGRRYEAQTNDNGVFAFSGIEDEGKYTVTVKHPSYNDATETANVRFGAVTALLYKIEMEKKPADVIPAILMGRVVDRKTGDPLPDVAVTVELDGTEFHVLTGYDGAYQVNDIMKEGRYTITAQREDYEDEVIHAVVRLGQVNEAPYDITMVKQASELGTLIGKVIDKETKAGLSGVAITLTMGEESYDATTGSDGSFRIIRIEKAGVYTLTAKLEAYKDGTATAQIRLKETTALTEPVELEKNTVESDGQFEYDYNSETDSYAISGVVEVSGKVTLPTTYKGKPVTGIGGPAFYRVTNEIEVTIPETFTRIDERAFDGCSGLVSVTIPDGVQSIAMCAFNGCENLVHVEFGGTVKSLGDYAFAHCSKLPEITLPTNITWIGENCFAYCSSLASAVISGNVRTIPQRAFFQCGNLETVTLPKSVTSIGSQALAECGKLKTIHMPFGYASIEDDVFYKSYALQSVYIGRNAGSSTEKALLKLKQNGFGLYTFSIIYSD